MDNLFSDIVRGIREAVPVASATPHHPEAKLRELVAPLWDGFIRSKRINLNFQPRDERQLANGRADTVFNRLILEYKKPGTIHKSNEKNRKLIAQVKGYIEDLSKEERWKEERLLGVAFDGDYFLFIRRVGRWIEEEPVPVSEQTVQTFLLTLEKLTTKAALIPDNLIRDFAIGTGSLNFIASNAIKAFYFALTRNVDERVRVFFDQWALQFAEVHGAVENKKFDAETLFTSYGFKKDEQKGFSLLSFFFALDTYYGLLMKLLAYQVVGFYTLKNVGGLPLTEWEKLDSDTFRDKLTTLEEGGIFRSDPLSIRNFLEGDLLSWYLNDWNDGIEKATRGIVERLNQYDPETMELVPDETRDILKKLYQFLVPKQIRHDLGEYYTPDWLAERCLNQVGYGAKERDLLSKRLLDPGCGSGTFLILAIKRAKEHARLKGVDPAETLQQITRNIVGFDLNPLAVISARTNYLLAIADLLKYKRGELTIPVYLCDSINPPSAKQQRDLFDTGVGYYQISTSVGPFRFPGELVQKAMVQKVTTLLEDSVRRKHSVQQFLAQVHGELKTDENRNQAMDGVLKNTYEKLLDLESKGINGIWARIIKNAFAPLLMGQFDFIVGNPPWVNWEALPKEYRDATGPIWQLYDLFEHTGLRARLGSAKDDISVLMTYVSIDRYLRNKGKLCVVITQTLFKTVGGGEGFRRFRLGKSGIPFKVLQVDDMAALQPFDSATNRTSVFLCQKGEETVYPVEYHIWKKKEKGSISIDFEWTEVQQRTITKYLKAQSIDGSLQGSWISARPRALKALRNVFGGSAYQGREGTNTGGANGVLWIEVKESNNGFCTIENLNEIGKKEIEPHSAEVEVDLIFPLLRGRDVARWSAKPSIQVLIPHDLSEPAKAIDPKVFQAKFPKTLMFLEYFETALRERALYKKYLQPQGVPFYGIYNIGAYTFAPYKVVWKEQSSELECAVVSSFEGKTVVPDHKLMLVPFSEENEAHYMCAVLESSVSRFIVQAYTIATQQSTHILENIKVPKYDPTDEIHQSLARLSKQCHEKVAGGIDVADLESQIDELAAELWGLSTEELTEIKASLEEMR
jgi:SAM-dependent methyltransferase